MGGEYFKDGRHESGFQKVLLLSVVLICSGFQARGQTQLPAGNGKAAVERACMISSAW
jgi:hypothetical protein